MWNDDMSSRQREQTAAREQTTVLLKERTRSRRTDSASKRGETRTRERRISGLDVLTCFVQSHLLVWPPVGSIPPSASLSGNSEHLVDHPSLQLKPMKKLDVRLATAALWRNDEQTDRWHLTLIFWPSSGSKSALKTPSRNQPYSPALCLKHLCFLCETKMLSVKKKSLKTLS